MKLTDLFPKLTADNYEITSPRTIKYNCIAWAAHDTKRWWQPGVYWPIESSRDDYGIGNVVAAFKSLGYEECDDGSLGDNSAAMACAPMLLTPCRATYPRKMPKDSGHRHHKVFRQPL
jgi:hypothetical protein